MKIDLSGKYALVTASSKGIGKGIAKVLSMVGANIIIVSRNRDNLNQAVKDLKKTALGEIYSYTADLSNIESLRDLVGWISGSFNNIDIFVFNTGGPKPGWFHELTMDDWVHASKLLLHSAIYLTHAVIPGMLKNKWGRIIYSTSVAIKEPVNGLVLSNTIRISIAGLVRSLAKEYGGRGITVNAIMPGYILTDRILEIAKKRAEEKNLGINEVINDMSKDIPVGRMGRPEEIGYLVAFLSSNYASYINGAIIPVDGGLLRSAL